MHIKTESLRGGLTAAVFACSLVVFGCSTNHTPGDGQPSMAPPMTPAATPGSSSGTTTNPPMASAMDMSTSVQRANDAAAIVASNQRERFLGYINPSGPQPTPPGQMPVTGQVIPPSQYANPEATVNASISSAPTPVITSGAGAGSTDDAATFLGDLAAVSTPTVTNSATATAATASATATPTTAALSATPGQFAAGATTTPTTAATGAVVNSAAVANTAALTPTLSSAATPSPTRAANPPLTSAGVTSSPTTATSSTAPFTTLASGRIVLPNGVVTSGSVRAVANANGTVTITNMPAVIKNK